MLRKSGLDSLRMVFIMRVICKNNLKERICGGSGQSFYPDALAKEQMSTSLEIPITTA